MAFVLWVVSMIIFFWVLHEVIRSAIDKTVAVRRLKENQELLKLLVHLKQRELKGGDGEASNEPSCRRCDLPASDSEGLCIMCRLRTF